MIGSSDIVIRLVQNTQQIGHRERFLHLINRNIENHLRFFQKLLQISILLTLVNGGFQNQIHKSSMIHKRLISICISKIDFFQFFQEIHFFQLSYVFKIQVNFIILRPISIHQFNLFFVHILQRNKRIQHHKLVFEQKISLKIASFSFRQSNSLNGFKYLQIMALPSLIYYKFNKMLQKILIKMLQKLQIVPINLAYQRDLSQIELSISQEQMNIIDQQFLVLRISRNEDLKALMGQCEHDNQVFFRFFCDLLVHQIHSQMG